MRIETAEQTAARSFDTEVAETPAPVAESNVEADEGEDRDSNTMPRRSRRSPRHLRVSGQRRRRYRDERYPNQSPMPLTFAAASPEMASGKVWITYPVAQVADGSEPAEHEQSVVPDYGHQDTAAAIAVASVDAQDNAQPQDEAQPVHIAEPQPENQPEITVVNTDETAAIETPVNEEPAVVSAADEPVADAITATAQPADDAVVDALEEIAEQADHIKEEYVAEEAHQVAAESAVEPSRETQQQVEEVLSAPEHVAEPVITSEPHAPVPARDEPVAEAEVNVTAPEAEAAAPAVASEPEVAAPVPVAAPAPVATPAPVTAAADAQPAYKHHATAPMTKAPAPAYEPEPARHSDWVRPAFNFEGKGSAGVTLRPIRQRLRQHARSH